MNDKGRVVRNFVVLYICIGIASSALGSGAFIQVILGVGVGIVMGLIASSIYQSDLEPDKKQNWLIGLTLVFVILLVAWSYGIAESKDGSYGALSTPTRMDTLDAISESQSEAPAVPGQPLTRVAADPSLGHAWSPIKSSISASTASASPEYASPSRASIPRSVGSNEICTYLTTMVKLYNRS